MNIEYYEKKALVKDLVERYFDVERFLKACEKCDLYDKNYSCPSHNFDVIQYISKYKNINLILAKVKLDDDERNIETYFDLLENAKVGIRDFLKKQENRKEGSEYINVGPCRECLVCNRAYGKSCEHREKIRYSIESLGGNVVSIVKDYFDEEILWVKDNIVPSYFIFLGGLVYN